MNPGVQGLHFFPETEYAAFRKDITGLFPQELCLTPQFFAATVSLSLFSSASKFTIGRHLKRTLHRTWKHKAPGETDLS
jgi:hypothetical protein